MNGNAFLHRGRVQAQGGRGEGIEESESWAQVDPLTAVAGHTLLRTLRGKLGQADQVVRATAFKEAHEFVERAKTSNGVAAPMKKSFPRKPNRHAERVDIEVQLGTAFVP